MDARLPEDAVAPGTHLLGLSPPMVGLARLADEYLVDGLAEGDGCLVVTTDRPARSVVASLTDLGTAPDPNRLGVVDATGQDPPPPPRRSPAASRRSGRPPT